MNSNQQPRFVRSEAWDALLQQPFLNAKLLWSLSCVCAELCNKARCHARPLVLRLHERDGHALAQLSSNVKSSTSCSSNSSSSSGSSSPASRRTTFVSCKELQYTAARDSEDHADAMCKAIAHCGQHMPHLASISINFGSAAATSEDCSTADDAAAAAAGCSEAAAVDKLLQLLTSSTPNITRLVLQTGHPLSSQQLRVLADGLHQLTELQLLTTPSSMPAPAWSTSVAAQAAGIMAWLAPLQQLDKLRQLQLQVPDATPAAQAGDGSNMYGGGGNSSQETGIAATQMPAATNLTSSSSSSSLRLLPPNLTSLTLSGFQERQLNDLSGPVQALSSSLQALQLQPAAAADPDNLVLLSPALNHLTGLTRLQVNLTEGGDFAVVWNLPPISQLTALSALRVLELLGCSPESDELPYIDAVGDLSSLASSCPQLQQLGPLYIDATTPPAPGVRFQHLRTLRVAHVPPNMPPLRLAALAPNLQNLAVSVYNRDQAAVAVQAISTSLTGLRCLRHLHLRMGCAEYSDTGLETYSFRFAASAVSSVLRPLRDAFSALTYNLEQEEQQQQQQGSPPTWQVVLPRQQQQQQQQQHGGQVEADQLNGEASANAGLGLQTLQFTLYLEATQSVRAFSDMISLLHVTKARQLKLRLRFAAQDELALYAAAGRTADEAAAAAAGTLSNHPQTAAAQHCAVTPRSATVKQRQYSGAFVKCMRQKWATSLEMLAVCGLKMDCLQVQQLIDGLPHLRFLQLVNCGLSPMDSSAGLCGSSNGTERAVGGRSSTRRLDEQLPQLKRSLRVVVQDSIDTSWLF